MAEAPRGSDGYAWVAVENLGDGRNRIVSELHIRICDKDIFAAALFNEPTEANVVPGGVATVLSALYVMDIRFRKLSIEMVARRIVDNANKIDARQASSTLCKRKSQIMRVVVQYNYADSWFRHSITTLIIVRRAVSR